MATNPDPLVLGSSLVQGMASGFGAGLGILAVGALAIFLTGNDKLAQRTGALRPKRLQWANPTPIQVGEVVQVTGAARAFLRSPVAEVIGIRTTPGGWFRRSTSKVVVRDATGKELTVGPETLRAFNPPAALYAISPAALRRTFGARNPIQEGDTRLVYLPEDMILAASAAVATGGKKGEGPLALYEFEITRGAGARGSRPARRTVWLHAFHAVKPETLRRPNARWRHYAAERAQTPGDYVAPFPPPGSHSPLTAWAVSSKMKARGQFHRVRAPGATGYPTD